VVSSAPRMPRDRGEEEDMIYVVVIDASKLRDQDHRRLEEFLRMPEEPNATTEDQKAAEGNLIATKSNIADASFETVLKRIDQAVDELRTTTNPSGS